MSKLIDELVSRLEPGVVRLRTKVRALRPLAAGWRLEIENGAAFDADAVVLACPAWAAAKLLAEVDEEYAAELAAVEFASCATVNLLYDSTAVGAQLHGYGFFVARTENTPLLACNYSSLKFAGRAPGGCFLLRAFLGGAGRPELDSIEDGELVRIAHESLAGLLDLRGAPRFGRARAFRRALPQVVVGSEQRRERLAAGLPRLAACGSAIGMIGLPDCIETAGHAAARVLEEAGGGAVADRAG